MPDIFITEQLAQIETIREEQIQKIDDAYDVAIVNLGHRYLQDNNLLTHDTEEFQGLIKTLGGFDGDWYEMKAAAKVANEEAEAAKKQASKEADRVNWKAMVAHVLPAVVTGIAFIFNPVPALIDKKTLHTIFNICSVVTVITAPFVPMRSKTSRKKEEEFKDMARDFENEECRLDDLAEEYPHVVRVAQAFINNDASFLKPRKNPEAGIGEETIEWEDDPIEEDEQPPFSAKDVSYEAVKVLQRLAL